MPYAEKPGAFSPHLIFFGVSISVGSITENESEKMTSFTSMSIYLPLFGRHPAGASTSIPAVEPYPTNW
jgi:hypothetical protein